MWAVSFASASTTESCTLEDECQTLVKVQAFFEHSEGRMPIPTHSLKTRTDIKCKYILNMITQTKNSAASLKIARTASARFYNYVKI